MVTSHAPSVAAVVLTWNQRLATLECIASLKRLSWPGLRVVAVDNASTDDTVAAVRERHPDVELIINEQNLGYAEGNNVGVRHALALGAEFIFILNNDTVVREDALEHLVAEADARPDAGALCPLIYFADPPDRIWYAGATFNPWRGRSGRMTAYGEPDSGQFTETVRVDRATGAAMLVPRHVIEAVGPLDPDLFLYYEDVEWSLRMRGHGFSIYLVPAAKVWHRVSLGAGGEHVPDSVYYATRNQLAVLNRHAPLGRLKDLRRQAAVVLVQIARVRHARRPLRHLHAVVQGWIDFGRRRLGPRPARSGAPAPRRRNAASRPSKEDR